MTPLVLVHGRDPGGRDGDEVEALWLAALNAGLDAAGSQLRVSDDDASFVYYGDTLAALVREPGGAPPPVTVHAVGVDAPAVDGLPEHEAAFVLAVAREVLRGAGTDEPGIQAQAEIRDSIQAILATVLALIDRHLPAVGAAVVLLLARDVYAYLHDDEVRSVLDAALEAAIPTDEPAVVVAHSLGSVIAYRVLRDAEPGRWDVPLFVSLGSPLAIRAIRDVLRAEAPLRVPPVVRRWVDVRDRRDILAVHGLTPEAFPLEPGSPAIEVLEVDNEAPAHHGAAELVGARPVGYLAVPAVAGLIDEPMTDAR